MRVGLRTWEEIGPLALVADGYLSYTKSMNIRKIMVAVFCVMGFAQPVLLAQTSYRTSFSNRLESSILQDFHVYQAPGLNRLRAMRFYRSDDQVQPTPRFWQVLFDGKETMQQQEYAMAFFLFNMYISTAAYREDMPSRLTLDYLGVLDGFSKCREMFALNQADNFYTKHRTAIKSQLAEFFRQAHLPEYSVSDPKNDRRELAFVRLLSTAPVRDHRPGYTWEGSTRLTLQSPMEEKALVTRMIRASLAEGENKVITFKVPRMQMENLDNPLATPKHSVDRLYRCVNDECAYCSYLLGKRFCQKIGASYLGRETIRLYKITAYPTAGEFLTPTQGESFVLANGGEASAWYYHTALLVIMDVNGHYTPFVADSFLAGDEPVLLEDWVKHFATQKTFFQVDVFERNQAVENAIVEPSSRQGDNIMIDGALYRPYDVLP